MSLEASLAALAESNNTLAAAMNNYAAVMTKYAGISVPGASNTTDAAPAGDTPAKSGRRTKAQIAADEAAAKAAEAPAEPDPFADEEPAAEEKELTLEDVRGLVMRLSKQDRDAALAVLKKVGAETISKIEPKNFQKVAELCAKEGVTL